MHRRSCLDAVGLFDESLRVLEDWDLWIRMSRQFCFAHLEQITAEFAKRHDGSTLTSGGLTEFIRTTQTIYGKYAAFVRDNPAVQQAQRQTLEAMVRSQQRDERRRKIPGYTLYRRLRAHLG